MDSNVKHANFFFRPKQVIAHVL